MLRWPRRTRLTAPLAALVLSACTTPPDQLVMPWETEGSGSTSTPDPTGGPSTMTAGVTTMVGTQGGSGMDTVGETENVDTTMGASASATTTGETTMGDTTMGVDPTTGDSGPPPMCMGPGDCGPNEDCMDGQCVSECATWGDGHYNYCLTDLGTFDSAVTCGEEGSCVYYGNPIEATVCGRSCSTLCDCPEGPGTGTAPVTCGNLVGDGGNECYLSCENGETCPDGMFCRENLYCTNQAQPVGPYGDCGAVSAGCAAGLTCATSSGGMSSWAVCIESCGNIGDCDPPPAGGTQGCGQVHNDVIGDECHLACDPESCPTGMICIDIGVGFGDLCMWPQ